MDKNVKKFEDRYSKVQNYYGEKPSTLFQKSKSYIKKYREIIGKTLKIVEVGGGQGRDSIALSRLLPDSQLICTDNAPAAVTSAKENISKQGLDEKISVQLQDVFIEYAEALSDSDILFANMCLHYHQEDTNPVDFVSETEKIFEYAVNSILPGGLFVFSVTSDQDSYFGKGEGIGVNTGVWENDGRIRHFFTKDFIENLMDRLGVKIKMMEVVEENYDHNIERIQSYYCVVGEKLKS